MVCSMMSCESVPDTYGCAPADRVLVVGNQPSAVSAAITFLMACDTTAGLVPSPPPIEQLLMTQSLLRSLDQMVVPGKPVSIQNAWLPTHPDFEGDQTFADAIAADSQATLGENGRSDTRIQRAIEQLLKSNAFDTQNIDVQVLDGHVTLTGQTHSAREKNYAYFSAWTPGVKSVRNEITVEQRQVLSDGELKRMLERAYAVDPRIVHTRPRVEVRNGVVTLRGAVASNQAKQVAKHVAMQFEGVTEVQDHLQVDTSLPQGESEDVDAIVLYDRKLQADAGSKADRELKHKIESELSWSPFVDADRINVEVQDGVAYLFGIVEDHDEMDAAIDNAFQAGAEGVVNTLTLGDPGDNFR